MAVRIGQEQQLQLSHKKYSIQQTSIWPPVEWNGVPVYLPNDQPEIVASAPRPNPSTT